MWFLPAGSLPATLDRDYRLIRETKRNARDSQTYRREMIYLSGQPESGLEFLSALVRSIAHMHTDCRSSSLDEILVWYMTIVRDWVTAGCVSRDRRLSALVKFYYAIFYVYQTYGNLTPRSCFFEICWINKNYILTWLTHGKLKTLKIYFKGLSRFQSVFQGWDILFLKLNRPR